MRASVYSQHRSLVGIPSSAACSVIPFAVSQSGKKKKKRVSEHIVSKKQYPQYYFAVFFRPSPTRFGLTV
ncbi:hypothetical protein NHX12_029358 [Muraenolepis orangiensis]|uniref:Uncharacterized protein n=1 Tax=Muraenolepis orangiensis TaxID=630683 RepID=A0A9Q0INJ6_9TELE|nr:hypothetical protein NHX12_029358 [Muraenolepis orangiensis]